MWYRTKVSSTYSFWTVNGTSGVGSPVEASSLIPPTQAFWVRTATTGTQLTLTNAMREHAPATNKLLKAPAANATGSSLIRLQLNDGTNTDEAVLYFNTNATEGMDAYDSPKMPNDDATVPEIYTTIGNEKIVINGMSELPLNKAIGLGFKSGSATSFSIKANELKNLPSDIRVILKDNITTTETDLTDGTTTYEFSPLATTTDRFSVIFRTQGAVTSLNNVVDKNIFVYSAERGKINVFVKNSSDKENFVSVFNGIGQQVMSQKIMNSDAKIDANFNPGIYLVKVNNTIMKVIVK